MNQTTKSVAMSSQVKKHPVPLLRIHNISFSYQQSFVDAMLRRNGESPATPFSLKGVSLDINRKEACGLIGESTCGKSTLGKLIIQLLRPDTDDGFIEFAGDGFAGTGNIFNYSRKMLRDYRKRVQMIFQNPDAALNPGMTVKALIVEAIQSCPKKRQLRTEIDQQLNEYLRMMNIQDREANYPDTLSGGEKRRVGIIRALAPEPDLIIADEPFANLDVSLRNHLINLFQKLKRENDVAFLFILHDVDIARYLCDRIAVMCFGRMVEIGTNQQLFAESTPKHPYTRELLNASEALKRPSAEEEGDWQVLQLANAGQGCVYQNRCLKYQELGAQEQSKCRRKSPVLEAVDANHKIACHFWDR